MAESPNWQSLYPFASRHLDLGGVRMHYIDEGAGRPVLMVHGNPTWSFYWRNVVQAVSAEYRAIAVDHVGCGLSDKPQAYEYCLEQHTANLVALIDQLDLREITLLVHDWGGAIGLGAAVQRSDRFAQLMVFNTGAFPPPFVPWRIKLCRTPLLGPLAVRGLNAFARAALVMATEHPRKLTAEVKAGLIAPYDTWQNRVAIQRFVDDIPFSQRHKTYAVLKQLEEQLPTLGHLPIRLVWGMRDWCFRPSCLYRFQEIWPSAEASEFEDAGHYVVEDACERIQPLLLEFLRSHDSYAPYQEA